MKVTFNYDIDKRSIIDHSGKELMAVDALTKMLGVELPKKVKPKTKQKTKAQKLKGPWRHDFRNNCVKCNRAFHLQRHHITYDPELVVFLCETCHSRITGINTRAAGIAGTSLAFKPAYTNQVRVTLWRWFLRNPWPIRKSKPVRRLSRSTIKSILASNKQLNPKAQSLKTTEGNNAGEHPNEPHLNTELSTSHSTGGSDTLLHDDNLTRHRAND